MLHLCRNGCDSILDLSCMTKLRILVCGGFPMYLVTIPTSLLMLSWSISDALGWERHTKKISFLDRPPENSMLIVLKLGYDFSPWADGEVRVAIGLHCSCYDWSRVASINAVIWDALVTLCFWVACFSMVAIHVVATHIAYSCNFDSCY
jgi:hypothetical protein